MLFIINKGKEMLILSKFFSKEINLKIHLVNKVHIYDFVS